jgi:LacI family transcriptional regulator
MGKADGLLMNLGRHPGVGDWLRRGDVLAVNTGGDLASEPRVVSVLTNPRSVASLAVRHFLDLARQQFAFVGDRRADATKLLQQAMVEELASHGLRLQTYGAEAVYSGTLEDIGSLEEVEPGLVRLLQEARKPLALLAQTDRYAAAICRVVELLGLAIPEDVAVVGVHDTKMARLFTPPISSIRPAHQLIGYQAARLLHRQLHGERLARRIVLLPALELVERESTIQRPRAEQTDVKWSLDYIREHVTDGIGIKHVADHVHIPRGTFQAEFAAAVGHTVG